MIEFKKVSLSFEGKEVFKNLSLTLPEKGLVLITGQSGCGKTSLARLITGLLKPDSGEVLTRGRKIAVVFQEDRLIPSLSAKDNVSLVSDPAEAEKRLCDMELSDAADLLPEELSGGMKRRVAIARALAFGGDLLLLDEAFSGIDTDLALRLIGKICTEYEEKLIVAVTHRPELFGQYEFTEIKL